MLKNALRLAFLLICLIVIGAPGLIARADDNMFPPAPAAAPFINFDGRGFIINGERTFVVSGGMEYARVPRALWRDRLLRLKRAGFNCVEIYTFWDYHEPHPGQFDFAGDHDLDAFLKTVKSLGLYAICRVGPYYCAEWDSGGFPVWLRFVPGLGVRQANPQFLAAVDRFWGKLLPIIAANQINHGGAVIMVQLENEHLQGGGTDIPNSYFAHLRDDAVSLGIQVPYFFSGLHHGGDPGGSGPWSSQGRTSPWMTTEFWSVNFDRYNQTTADVDSYDRKIWKLLAHGGNGLNIYMLHGGTNFGYTNNDEDAASYDYGSAIGQAGDLRPTFYRFKRAALFARSFESVLENSDNASDTYKSVATNSNIQVTGRTAPAGTIVFLDNSGASTVQSQIKESDGSLFPTAPLTLTPGQILPLVENYALFPGVTLERSTPLLGVLKQGSVTTVVAYGPVGDPIDLHFKSDSLATNVSSGIAAGDGNRLMLQTTAASGSAAQYSFQAGAQTIRVLAMSTALADRTWFVGDTVVVGPAYAGEMGTQNGQLRLLTETSDGTTPSTAVYGQDLLGPRILQSASTPGAYPDAPSIGPWQSLPAYAEASPSYPDTTWLESADPLAMGADGDSTAYAWYRTSVDLPKAGNYRLKFTDGGDWASVFVNGQHVASAPITKGVPLKLTAGPTRLAIFVAHYGRPKEFGHMGPIDTLDAKGIRGAVALDNANVAGPAITTWRVQADAGAGHTAVPTDTAGAGWSDGTTGPDIFNFRHGFAWYVTSLPVLAGEHHRVHFENVDDNATVFLNGQQVAAHEGWGAPFDAPLDSAWNPNGPNTLAVLVENTSGPGGIQGAVTLQALNMGDEIAVTDWRMRGGIPEPAALSGWQSGAVASADDSPAYYRTTFVAVPPGETGPHPILRVSTSGLSSGFVWLNGHNLGRYPEKIPIDGLYMPECWQNTGRNELVVFDEQGRSPMQVKIWTEQAASRVVVPMAER